MIEYDENKVNGDDATYHGVEDQSTYELISILGKKNPQKTIGLQTYVPFYIILYTFSNTMLYVGPWD